MTVLEPLQKFEIEYLRSKSPGRPPDLKWLRLAELGINPAYQRSITKKGLATIQKIMAEFSWSRFSPVIVCRVPGPTVQYEIIDGQHRSTAALNCGYELVPCMIVHCDDVEAARIFAAVNGNVTPMQPVSVYKAAVAGGEPWALECKAAAEAAGCQILTRPTPHSLQKPYQTMSVGGIRSVWRQHGPRVLGAAFKLLKASHGSQKLGFMTNVLIVSWSRVLASRPGWVENIDHVCDVVAAMQIGFVNDSVEILEERIAKRVGDDGRGGEALEDIKAKVADCLGRRMSAQMIATSLRLPYAQVNAMIAEIRALTPKLEARR